jgi:Xaa-Pro aminopeptidase
MPSGHWLARWWTPRVYAADGGAVPASLRTLLAGVALGMGAFAGYGGAVILSEETQGPRRGVARAMLGALGVAVFAELLAITAALVGAPSQAQLTSAPAPMSYLVRSLGGDRLVTIMTLALVATFFNILLAVLLEYARVLYSSGRDRTWPAPLSQALDRIHPTTRTPVTATLAIGVAALTLTAVSDYAAAVTFASLTVVVTFTLIALSALASRLRQPGLARPYRMPLWPLPPLVALVGVAITVLLQTGRDLAIVAGILAAGVLYDAAYLRPRRDTHWVLLDPPAASRTSARGGPDAVSLSDWSDGGDPYAATAKLLDPQGRYAISDSAWAMHLLGLQEALPESRYVSMTSGLPMLRAVKDADELERLAAAGVSADRSFEQILGVRFAGRREDEIGAELARFLRDHGHSEVDFTVVGSGPNGANPHHEVSGRTIEEGDMVVLDFGGLQDGYGSDTTRTVHVGEPTDEEREVFEIVRRAQQAAFEAVRPGVACQEIDRVARKVIDDAGYGEYFIRRTGHGIGLTTHEPPYMVEGETHQLEPGMCFSIEPGIYLPGRFGVRIEDIVTVTDDAGRRLNTTDHELQIVS